MPKEPDAITRLQGEVGRTVQQVEAIAQSFTASIGGAIGDLKGLVDDSLSAVKDLYSDISGELGGILDELESIPGNPLGGAIDSVRGMDGAIGDTLNGVTSVVDDGFAKFEELGADAMLASGGGFEALDKMTDAIGGASSLFDNTASVADNIVPKVASFSNQIESFAEFSPEQAGGFVFQLTSIGGLASDISTTSRDIAAQARDLATATTAATAEVRLASSLLGQNQGVVNTGHFQSHHLGALVRAFTGSEPPQEFADILAAVPSYRVASEGFAGALSVVENAERAAELRGSLPVLAAKASAYGSAASRLSVSASVAASLVTVPSSSLISDLLPRQAEAILQATGDSLSSFDFGQSFAGDFDSQINSVTDTFTASFDSFQDTFNTASAQVDSAINKMSGQIDNFTSEISSVTDKFTDQIDSLTKSNELLSGLSFLGSEGPVDKLGGLAESADDLAKGVMNDAKACFEPAATAVMKSATGMMDDAKTMAKDVASSVTQLKDDALSLKDDILSSGGDVDIATRLDGFTQQLGGITQQVTVGFEGLADSALSSISSMKSGVESAVSCSIDLLNSTVAEVEGLVSKAKAQIVAAAKGAEDLIKQLDSKEFKSKIKKTINDLGSKITQQVQKVGDKLNELVAKVADPKALENLLEVTADPPLLDTTISLQFGIEGLFSVSASASLSIAKGGVGLDASFEASAASAASALNVSALSQSLSDSISSLEKIPEGFGELIPSIEEGAKALSAQMIEVADNLVAAAEDFTAKAFTKIQSVFTKAKQIANKVAKVADIVLKKTWQPVRDHEHPVKETGHVPFGPDPAPPTI